MPTIITKASAYAFGKVRSFSIRSMLILGHRLIPDNQSIVREILEGLEVSTQFYNLFDKQPLIYDSLSRFIRCGELLRGLEGVIITVTANLSESKADLWSVP